MPRKKKPEPTLTGFDGREIARRFKTEYWFDGRLSEPSRWTRGFPQAEDGSIEGAGRVVLKGFAVKVKCFDRVTGKYIWTIVRGGRVPGTHVYTPVITPGDADAKPTTPRNERPRAR